MQARERSTRCVLLPHGIADSRVSALGFAPMFLQAGYTVLAPDIFWRLQPMVDIGYGT